MAFQDNSIYWVDLAKVVPNPYQPRREFDQHKLQELADSIRMYGVLQPLTVTRKEVHSEDGTFYAEYELIAGERRLRASKLAGIEQVPVIIRSGEETEQEKLELAIIENLQREDLNSVDRALAFQQLAQVFELSHTEVARKVGRSREYVSNSIRLLMLPETILDSLRTGDISEGHARSLLMLKERPEEQDVVYREILLKKLSVREVERITRKIATDKVRKKDWNKMYAGLIEIEKAFTETLGTRVQIQKTDFGGKLTIDYFSENDLQRLLDMVKSQGHITQGVESAGNQTQVDEQESESVVVQTLAAATPLQTVPTISEEPPKAPLPPTVHYHEDKTSSVHQAIAASAAAESQLIDAVATEAVMHSEQRVQASPAYEEPTEIPPAPIMQQPDYQPYVPPVTQPAPAPYVPNTPVPPPSPQPERQYNQYQQPPQQPAPAPTIEKFRVPQQPPVQQPVTPVAPPVTTAQPPSVHNPQPPIPAQPAVPPVTNKVEDDDSDLYTMRNFSL